MNGGERVQTHTSKQSKVPLSFGIVSMPLKQGQKPTSSLYWCVSASVFSATDVANSIWMEYFLLMRPLIQIPLKLGSCFTLCGLRPGFNPFYILRLPWRTTLYVPNKRMTEIPVLPVPRKAVTSYSAGSFPTNEMWSDCLNSNFDLIVQAVFKTPKNKCFLMSLLLAIDIT